MRTFLGTLVILFLLFAAVGYFRGWFDISTASQDHKANVSITVDKEKLREDSHKAVKGLEELTDKVKAKTDSEKVQDKGN